MKIITNPAVSSNRTVKRFEGAYTPQGVMVANWL